MKTCHIVYRGGKNGVVFHSRAGHSGVGWVEFPAHGQSLGGDVAAGKNLALVSINRIKSVQHLSARYSMPIS